MAAAVRFDDVLKVNFSKTAAVAVIPLNCFFESITKGMPCLEPNRLLDPAHIEASSWLYVGLGRVPDDPALISNLRSDDVGERLDGDFLPGS